MNGASLEVVAEPANARWKDWAMAFRELEPREVF
jgi:hypothetical protein